MATAALGDIRQVFHRTSWAFLLRGLLSIAVGVFILARPLESVAAFALVIAFWALFSGLVGIVHAFDVRPVMKQWWVLLLSGLVGVGFGIASLLYYPVLSLTYAVVWVAWWLMLTGILGIYGAMQERSIGEHWGWTAAFGVLSVIASAFALLAPPITLTAIMALIAWFAIVSGVALLIGAFKLRSVVG
ncbi:MAG TPA: DUF308 domain-containing protein [Gemmatimonadales bacterium]|nr:DUF308 domain-containing protein [Gemmatimonadales bacterium]